jgi:hypothetical protein
MADNDHQEARLVLQRRVVKIIFFSLLLDLLGMYLSFCCSSPSWVSLTLNLCIIQILSFKRLFF